MYIHIFKCFSRNFRITNAFPEDACSLPLSSSRSLPSSYLTPLYVLQFLPFHFFPSPFTLNVFRITYSTVIFPRVSRAKPNELEYTSMRNEVRQMCPRCRRLYRLRKIEFCWVYANFTTRFLVQTRLFINSYTQMIFLWLYHLFYLSFINECSLIRDNLHW